MRRIAEIESFLFVSLAKSRGVRADRNRQGLQRLRRHVARGLPLQNICDILLDGHGCDDSQSSVLSGNFKRPTQMLGRSTLSPHAHVAVDPYLCRSSFRDLNRLAPDANRQYAAKLVGRPTHAPCRPIGRMNRYLRETIKRQEPHSNIGLLRCRERGAEKLEQQHRDQQHSRFLCRCESRKPRVSVGISRIARGSRLPRYGKPV